VLTSDTALELFRTRRLVILDFDGPVSRLLPDPRHIELADEVKGLLTAQGVLPPDVSALTDHVQLLRYAATALPHLLPALESLCSSAELAAADTATPATGAVEVLELLRSQRRPLAIVTNNDPRVVTRFAQRQGIALTGISVHGREPGHPERLKPAPWMLHAALIAHGCAPGEALLIGDSATDVASATAAGMPCVGLASDEARRAALRSAGAVGTVPDLGVFRGRGR